MRPIVQKSLSRGGDYENDNPRVYRGIRALYCLICVSCILNDVLKRLT